MADKDEAFTGGMGCNRQSSKRECKCHSQQASANKSYKSCFHVGTLPVDVNRCSPEVDKLSLESSLVRLLGQTLVDIRHAFSASRTRGAPKAEVPGVTA